MKTKLFMISAVGLLGAGVIIHHTGHCPLRDAKMAMEKHAVKPDARTNTPPPAVVAAVADAK